MKAQAPAVHGPPRKSRLGWGHSDVSLCPRSSFGHLPQEAILFVRPSSPQAAPRSAYPVIPGACSMVLGGGQWSGQTTVPNLGGRLPGLCWSRSMACTPVRGSCLSLVPNPASLCRHAGGALNSHAFRCVPPFALKAVSFLLAHLVPSEGGAQFSFHRAAPQAVCPGVVFAQRSHLFPIHQPTAGVLFSSVQKQGWLPDKGCLALPAWPTVEQSCPPTAPAQGQRHALSLRPPVTADDRGGNMAHGQPIYRLAGDL